MIKIENRHNLVYYFVQDYPVDYFGHTRLPNECNLCKLLLCDFYLIVTTLHSGICYCKVVCRLSDEHYELGLLVNCCLTSEIYNKTATSNELNDELTVGTEYNNLNYITN